MSKLITLGCSFSQGIGCYDIELYKSYNLNNINLFPVEYHNKTRKLCLENSIGKHIQDEFGFEEYYNYAHAGSSNQTQVLKFFNNLPEGNDNTILWQITYYDRKPMFKNNSFDDNHWGNDNWVNSYYLELSSKLGNNLNEIQTNEMIELKMYMNIMYEFCKIRGWNFYVWFFMDNECDKFIKQFPESKKYTIPFKNINMNEMESYKDITLDNHPNQFEYRRIANGLIKTIQLTYPTFPNPNEIPKKWYWVNKDIK